MVWGPEVFEALRSIASPALDRIVKLLTDLGSENFYTAAVPIVYWCISKSMGFGLGVTAVISGALNIALKDAFRVPRPYVLYPGLGAPDFLLNTGTGWSYPSGHAQSTATFWWYLAFSTRAIWAVWAAAIMTVVISFTRVYATVHSPTDVMAGALIGAALAAVYVGAERGPQGRKLVSTGPLVTAAVALPAGVLALSSWLSGAELAQNLAPLMGFAAGTIIGYRIERLHIGFREQAPIGIQIAKALMGVAGIFAVRYGLKAVFPSGLAWTMIRYAAIALWITAGAPYVFRALWPQVAGVAGNSRERRGSQERRQG